MFKLPKYGSPKQNIYDDPIKVLECVDIVFFSQFDVPEHVFNIGLMIGLLLMVQRTLPKSFHTRKIPKKWPHLAPKGLGRKYTKNPCFLRSLRLLDVPIIFWNVMISFSSIYLMYLNTIDLIVFRDIQLIKENDIKI